MQLLFYFFRKYRYFLFFLILQVIALALTINNHSFHKSKFISSANGLTGGVYSKVTSVSDYLNLRTENDHLIQENLNLREQLNALLSAIDTPKVTQIIQNQFSQQYQYISGKIVKNQYTSQYNYLTINLGVKDSVSSEMAVFNNKGIIGITDISGTNYSRVISILNRDSRINARPKNSSYFGTLTWDGLDYNTVQLTDIPRQVNLQVGDTIITGGKSAIFPEGLLIGSVKEVINPNSATKIVQITLFNDMSNLRNIYVVRNFDKQEIEELETLPNE